MSASPQSSRFLWLALALGPVAPALAQAPAPVASPFLPTAPYTLVGMSADPQETTVCIFVAKEKRSVWIPVGETNDGIDVVSFDAQKEQALIRTGSLKLLLTLQEAPGLRRRGGAPMQARRPVRERRPVPPPPRPRRMPTPPKSGRQTGCSSAISSSFPRSSGRPTPPPQRRRATPERMRILISGVCGFVGTTLARALAEASPRHEISGFDNFIRPGSETNRAELKRLGVKLFHGDLRSASDVDALPASDWFLDAAANPSVLAGVDGQSSSRQLVEHNLVGTANVLEHCKKHRSGFILLSTSRVYSIPPLANLPVEVSDRAFRLGPASQGRPIPSGVSPAGLDEMFSTRAPVSLYGATKLAAEALALEYGETFGIPVFINRCGVLAGAGQFGRPDQGIFAYWINSWLQKRPLRYIGFGGSGHQVRDVLHPKDLLPLLEKQFVGARAPCRRPDRQSGRRLRERHFAQAAERLVRRGTRPPLGGLRSRAPAIRHPVDGSRLVEGRPALELAAPDRHGGDPGGDRRPRPSAPGVARPVRPALMAAPPSLYSVVMPARDEEARSRRP